MALQKKYNLSFWEAETFFKGIDVVVIGSGIVGLTAAVHLREQRPGLRIAVFERGPLPIGASSRNAGFACFGSMTELLDDIRRMGEDAVWQLVERRWRGLRRLRDRLGDDCLDYQPLGGHELFSDEDQDQIEACLNHLDSFNRTLAGITGHPAVFSRADELIPRFGFRRMCSLIRNAAEGQLHTGKMIAALVKLARSQEVEVYTGLEVAGIEDDGRGAVILTETGWDIRARSVLVATNGFARQLFPELPVHPARNQVLVTQPVPGLAVRGAFHYDRGYYYFRNIEDRLLLGGGRNLAEGEEQTHELGTTPLIRAALTRLLREVVLPGRSVEVDCWWSGVLGLGTEKSPVIRKVSPHVGVAVRLGGMGVAIGSLVGEQGAEMVLEGLE